MDVVTDSEFIEKGSKLEVVEVEGIRVVVREIKDDKEIDKTG